MEDKIRKLLKQYKADLKEMTKRIKTYDLDKVGDEDFYDLAGKKDMLVDVVDELETLLRE